MLRPTECGSLPERSGGLEVGGGAARCRRVAVMVAPYWRRGQPLLRRQDAGAAQTADCRRRRLRRWLLAGFASPATGGRGRPAGGDVAVLQRRWRRLVVAALCRAWDAGFGGARAADGVVVSMGWAVSCFTCQYVISGPRFQRFCFLFLQIRGQYVFQPYRRRFRYGYVSETQYGTSLTCRGNRDRNLAYRP